MTTMSPQEDELCSIASERSFRVEDRIAALQALAIHRLADVIEKLPASMGAQLTAFMEAAAAQEREGRGHR